MDPGLAISIGVAAHICAAAEGGPRFDPAQTPAQRADLSNGIWLCQNCAKLIDNDARRFTADQLHNWKITAEAAAIERIGGGMEVPLPYLPTQSREPIASLTNQGTPAESCLEFLRLENLHAPWLDMQPEFDAARIMIDGSGARIGWDVVEMRSSSETAFAEVLAKFGAISPSVVGREQLTLHYLAIVFCVGGTAENEAAAVALESYVSKLAGRYGIRLHIGYMAGMRYVDRVVTAA